ncbi:PL29 family lyase N-terminal domain-containing protein [Bacteroides acidifaciens]|uniref:PL29 family lyase N-terminal domain-containing protein n=1 Tax=Bacteroides acidifaciens TaxID=85831 RepID=UPI0025974FF2|nr:PL29 family lyase N-terminal domain-containing protein [uncultured Bacteroides sp.]
MNYFKSFLLTAFALFTLAACNTDDLRDDVDNLKGRVESLEAQINLLNDNMTAIKRLLEGGQTITEITQTNGTYTLKLSGGETVTLTQGSAGEIKYPEISVNDEGQWVVNGEVLTQNGVPVQAVGTPGNDGITPKFRLTDDGSYWQVSYDNGTSWQDVLDESGNKVSAVNNGSSGGSSTDTFFESAGIDESGDFFVIQLKGQTESISIPIVKDLLCEIIEPAEGMNKGYWEIGSGATATTTVKVKGDNIIVTAPAGWVATISEPDTETNEATLSITAPASTIKTRATADNSSDVTLQVNKGANWAVAKIQVKAIEIIDSYYALYEAGETITIGGINVNKDTFGEATLITTENPNITNKGIYFISPEVEAEYTASGGYAQLIIIGNSSTQKSQLKVSSQIKLVETASDASGIFICQNITLDARNTLNAENKTSYPIVQNKNGAFGSIILQDCHILLPKGQPLSYISNSNRSIDYFLMENCVVPISSTDNNKFILSLSTSTAAYNRVSFKNNIFYCVDEGKSATGFKLMNGEKATATEFTLTNNTFVNVYTATTFYVYLTSLPNIHITHNLIYAKPTMPNNCGIFRLTNNPESGECNSNICYKAENTNNWQIFFGGIGKGMDGAEEVNIITSDPFEGGTFDIANGVFIPNAEFAEYGASIN